MENISQISVDKILGVGCSDDKKTGWIDFSVDGKNALRLAFPVEFPPDIKLALQLLQKHVAEERKKVGLPVIESLYTAAVERLEFWRDDINQIAGIRTRFQNGASTDTPIEKAQIRQTIEFLNAAILAFEAQAAKH